MTISERKFKDKIRNLSDGVSRRAQTIARYCYIQSFLHRLSHSRYKDQFIVKGGVLLASTLGIDLRATIDLDLTLLSTYDRKTLERIIDEIASIDTNDGIVYRLRKLSPIRDGVSDIGIRIILDVEHHKARDIVQLDITAGDVITPGIVKRSMKMIITGEEIELFTYPFETVIAEKVNSFISHGVDNTRMRDFYDLGLLWASYQKEINVPTLSSAIYATAESRSNLDALRDWRAIHRQVSNNVFQRDLWARYAETEEYDVTIHWEDALEAIEDILSICEVHWVPYKSEDEMER